MALDQLIGVGLRYPHYNQVLEERPSIGWFEVHSENFFHQGGPLIDTICSIREHYPLSLHGVGLSLGSSGGILQDHLLRLKQLIERTDPFLVSEHLSWGRIAGVYMPDLLPVPYTSESLNTFCHNVNITQDFLGRNILIENPSSYVEYKATDREEVDFLVELCKRTGAGILLDVNNVFVSCSNHGWNAKRYINAIPYGMVQEIHLAGHSIKDIAPGKILRVDTHDHDVSDEVWELYSYTVQRFGAIPTLLEWDAEIPSLDFLIQEASKALEYLPINRRACANA